MLKRPISTSVLCFCSHRTHKTLNRFTPISLPPLISLKSHRPIHSHKVLAMADETLASKQARKHTNQLSLEHNPYLLQHAHNPVNWYPWGEEVFEEARKRDIPNPNLLIKNPVRPLNGLGSAIAILGTFLYSQATTKKKGGEKNN